MDQAITEGNFKGQCKALHFLAEYSLIEKDSLLAQEYLRKAKLIADSHFPKKHFIHLERILHEAELYQLQGKLNLALKSIERALKVAKTITHKNKDALIASFLALRGEIFIDLEEKENGIKEITRGLELLKSIFGTKSVLIVPYLTKRGIIFYFLKRLKEAKLDIEMTIQILENSPFPDKKTLQWCYSTLGDILYNFDHILAAKEAIMKAIDLLSQSEDILTIERKMLAYNYYLLAHCLMELDHSEEAVIYAKRAVEYSEMGESGFEIYKQFAQDLEDEISN